MSMSTFRAGMTEMEVSWKQEKTQCTANSFTTAPGCQDSVCALLLHGICNFQESMWVQICRFISIFWQSCFFSFLEIRKSFETVVVVVGNPRDCESNDDTGRGYPEQSSLQLIAWAAKHQLC